MQPETIEIVPSTSASACAAPGVTRPELPDTLSPIERPDFVMDPRPPTTVTIDKKMIAIGDPGVPGGVPGGIGVDPGSILPAGMLDNPPHTRTQVSPAYPFEAQKAGLTGTVWVEFVVDTSGYVHDPVAVRSTDRVFEAASVRAVSRWRFEPGKRDGRPVSFRMVVPVVFNLTEE
jgi:protein TonB